MNATATALNIITWIVILLAIRMIYRKQEWRPKLWKMLIVVFVGLFSFSINLPFFDQQVKLAILPLGVWILYGLYSRKNEGESWEKYRKYAWLGFLANYLFLAMSILSILLHAGIYPKNDIGTYISEINGAHIIKTHPSAANLTLDRHLLMSQIDNMKYEPIYSDEWYRETFETSAEENRKDERFPYQLTGINSKWGSGVHSLILVERDGKGILITTGQEQFYFRSDQSFLKEGK
ncbi:hypothetical protein M3204_10815 [Mesobacillus subterraneus]|uniref:hypothetical protein n=1 Tax=Mesobacillus subterraneus TaxID=285983 RepID=UPI00203C80FB|nr:hypothetical protein [Mesobacillus subterraneus]MCM3664899.1 hypothetical protein [Mesobacillus subterraneus]MCM3681987.1 hypothetical protein [Mesobacillus subterraneus]